ncbi:variable surface protein [Plasmodium gonderi]|uniref:Variable surface protein n=1 Tax=Plasmodium gonderi TaxID=77519 RepID=A0A1Y1JPV4_PLAGO|nr:variable surface protein [Plasmodium gonderi]GAW84240.1 variable surface protein [Plasmodium gonderi]
MEEEITQKNVVCSFDFDAIFPNCKNNYNANWRSMKRGEFYNLSSKMCTNFSYFIHPKYVGGQEFQENCIPIGLYLYYIEEEYRNKSSGFNIDPLCSYFYYNLKDIVIRYNSNCIENGNCYDTLRKKSTGSNPIHIPDICKHIVDNMMIIQQYLYDVFYGLHSNDNNSSSLVYSLWFVSTKKFKGIKAYVKKKK